MVLGRLIVALPRFGLFALLPLFAPIPAFAIDTTPSEAPLRPLDKSESSPTEEEPTPALAPAATLAFEFWDNANGGLHKGSRWNSLLDVSLTANLAKLFSGPANSTFVAQALWVQNQKSDFFADLAGASNPTSGIMAEDQVRVFNLHYRQTWNKDALILKVGQQAADDDFMGSDYASVFLNSAFGAMPSQVATPLSAARSNTAAFPGYAVAAPGVFVAVKPIESIYLQAAAYVGSPGRDISRNHGFDWKYNSDAGTAFFAEAGGTYHVGSRPGTVRLGGTAHTGTFDNLTALNEGAEEATVRGLHSFYAGVDQALWVDTAGKPLLGVFWRGGTSPQGDRSIVTRYTDAGLVWNQPFGRTEDALGLAYGSTTFGRAYVASTGPDGTARHESTLEITYRCRINGHCSVQADVQWLFNPAVNADTGRRETATVLGVRTEFAF